MNNEKVFEEAIQDARDVYGTALKNAKTALQEVFDEEHEATEQDIDEVITELENEVNTSDIKEEKKAKKRQKRNDPSAFWKNLWYVLYKPWRKSEMVKKFQKLAGITPDCVARVTINKTQIEFIELPKWYDVIRYKLCGFKLEIYRKQL